MSQERDLASIELHDGKIYGVGMPTTLKRSTEAPKDIIIDKGRVYAATVLAYILGSG
jgi:hypothetical protein